MDAGAENQGAEPRKRSRDNGAPAGEAAGFRVPAGNLAQRKAGVGTFPKCKDRFFGLGPEPGGAGGKPLDHEAFRGGKSFHGEKGGKTRSGPGSSPASSRERTEGVIFREWSETKFSR